MEPHLTKSEGIEVALIRGKEIEINANPVEKVQQDTINGGFHLLEKTFSAWNNNKIKSQVEALHIQGIACFVYVEINSKIEVIGVSVETDFDDYSKKADSPKLLEYNKAELKYKIPVLIWSKNPNACYTCLLLKPWLSPDEIEKLTLDLKYISLFSHICANCGTPNPKKKCPCDAVKYCNIDCQKLDWKKHKLQCNYKK